MNSGNPPQEQKGATTSGKKARTTKKYTMANFSVIPRLNALADQALEQKQGKKYIAKKGSYEKQFYKTLIFSPSYFKKYLRIHLGIGYRAGNKSMLNLTARIQHVIGELIIAAHKKMLKDRKLKRIHPVHIQQALLEDKPLEQVFHNPGEPLPSTLIKFGIPIDGINPFLLPRQKENEPENTQPKNVGQTKNEISRGAGQKHFLDKEAKKVLNDLTLSLLIKFLDTVNSGSFTRTYSKNTTHNKTLTAKDLKAAANLILHDTLLLDLNNLNADYCCKYDLEETKIKEREGEYNTKYAKYLETLRNKA